MCGVCVVYVGGCITSNSCFENMGMIFLMILNGVRPVCDQFITFLDFSLHMHAPRHIKHTCPCVSKQ